MGRGWGTPRKGGAHCSAGSAVPAAPPEPLAASPYQRRAAAGLQHRDKRGLQGRGGRGGAGGSVGLCCGAQPIGCCTGIPTAHKVGSGGGGGWGPITALCRSWSPSVPPRSSYCPIASHVPPPRDVLPIPHPSTPPWDPHPLPQLHLCAPQPCAPLRSSVCT